MAVAFSTTHTASSRTGLQRQADQFFIRPRTASRDRSSGCTDIRTVKVEPNALAKLLDHVFSEAGIRARDAGLGAGVTLLDAADQGIIDVPLYFGVRSDHLAS